MSQKSSGCAAITILVFILVGVIGSCVAQNSNKQTITITIAEKHMAGNGKGITQHIIDNNGMIYTCDDQIFQGVWDSATLFARMKQGKTYKVVVVGVRYPPLSMFQNIIAVLGEVDTELPVSKQ